MKKKKVVHHYGGKTRKKRCPFKKYGKCPCGCHGQKKHEVPDPYRDDEDFIKRVEKWKRKNARRKKAKMLRVL